MIWLAIAITMVATAAPGPESVRVEMHSPMHAIPDSTASMYTPEAPTRASPSVTDRVDPDRVGNGLNPNTTAPATTPETIVTATSPPSSVIDEQYFASTSRVRRTGRSSR